MERTNEGRLTKKTYRVDLYGVRKRGRPRKRRRERVRELVEQMGFSFEECERLARDRSDREMIMYGGRDAGRVPRN